MIIVIIVIIVIIAIIVIIVIMIIIFVTIMMMIRVSYSPPKCDLPIPPLVDVSSVVVTPIRAQPS